MFYVIKILFFNFLFTRGFINFTLVYLAGLRTKTLIIYHVKLSH